MVLLLANERDNLIKNKLFFDIQFFIKGFQIHDIIGNSQMPKPKKKNPASKVDWLKEVTTQ
jgi:hypothetical protein